MMATTLNSAMLDLPFCTKLWLKLVQSDSNSFILTQLDDGSHLEFCNYGFCHLHKKNFTHAFSLKLIYCSHLECCYLGFSHFAQKKTSLVHSASTWWWQPSWILQCWIQTLPSWIEIPCYLLSDSLKKHSHSILTLTQTSSIWLKLIHSHLTW